MWLRTLLIVLLIFLLVRALSRLMRGIAQGVSAPGGTRVPHAGAVKMVADPVCGTFVVPGKALQAARRGETQYFCSEACRERWAASR